MIGGLFPATSFVSKLSNFLLTSIGFASSVSLRGGEMVAEDPKFVGVSSKFFLRPSSLLGASQFAVPFKIKAVGDCKPPDKFDKESVSYYFCPYREARVLELVVTIEPVNQLSNRQGMVYACIVPMRSEDTIKSWETDSALLVEQFAHQPIRAMARFGQPISLVFRPTIHDGMAYQFQKLESDVLGVAITF